MLLKIDKGFQWVVWVVAAAFAWGLVIGPYAIAEDDAVRSAESAGAAPYGSTPGADGSKVFTASCGSCHTLSAAGTSGQVGPNLDDTSLSASEIETIVRDGRATMPAFGGQLSDAEISAVAAFVSAAP